MPKSFHCETQINFFLNAKKCKSKIEVCCRWWKSFLSSLSLFLTVSTPPKRRWTRSSLVDSIVRTNLDYMKGYLKKTMISDVNYVKQQKQLKMQVFFSFNNVEHLFHSIDLIDWTIASSRMKTPGVLISKIFLKVV